MICTSYRMEEIRKDFEEYVEDSRTLELEMDTQLKQLEKKNKDLIHSMNRLQDDNSNMRVSSPSPQ